MNTQNPCKPSLLLSAAVLAALAAAPGAAVAAEAIPDIEIVATPIVEEVALDPFAATAAVVTDKQLRDQNAVDLASALRRTPGVQISRYNPVGSFGGDQGGAVFIRGMGVSRPGSEIKTYVDGVPVYMGVWNHPLLDLLPVNGMQSVTVYKSPQPQASGNNLAAVELLTRRAMRDGIEGDAQLAFGSYSTVAEQVTLVGKNGAFDFSLAQGYAKSDGHRDGADGRLGNVIAHVGYALDEHWRLSANLLWVDNDASDPGDTRLGPQAVAPQYDTSVRSLAVALEHGHGDWRGRLLAYTNEGDGDWLDQAGLDGDTLSHFRLSGVRWQEEFSPWVGGTLRVGLDHDRVSGDVDFNRVLPAPSASVDPPTFKVTSIHAGLAQSFDLAQGWRLVPSAGLRAYDHSEFGGEVAPFLGVSLVSDALTLFANASRGVNYPGLEAPVLSALIPPLGNSWTALDPETMDHLEVGMKWQPITGASIDLSLFSDRLENRYVFGFPPEVPPPPQFINLGSYRMRGLELSASAALGAGWSGFAGLTLLDPSIDGLPYTPRRALTVGLNGRVGPVNFAVDAQYQSSVLALNRPRAAGALNTEAVPTFAVVNARLGLPIGARQRMEAFIAVENLFDREYAYRPGYPMPGTWGQLGLRTRF